MNPLGEKYLLRKHVRGDVEEEAILERSSGCTRTTGASPVRWARRRHRATGVGHRRTAPPHRATHVRSLGQAGHGHDRQLQQRANKLATRGHHTNRSGREMNGAGGLVSPPTHVCPCEAGAPINVGMFPSPVRAPLPVQL
jgi:hypothetical protein